MKFTICALASTLVITVAGCAARNPVEPVPDSGRAAAGIVEEPFVLNSARDARLPAPLQEARDAGASDLAITGAATSARGEGALASADPVVFWNRFTSTLARAAGLPPPRFARAYALTQVAIFDALIAGSDAARGGLSGPALAAGAATKVLTYLFPGAAAGIMAAAEQQIAGEDRQAMLRSWRLGAAVGDLVVRYGQRDRSDTPFTSTIPDGPGLWNGTIPVLPTCGEWRTWILTSGEEFSPDPPYPYGSPQDLADVAEVLEVSQHRTPEQILVVHKWADLPPPMIWSDLLNDRIVSRNLPLREAARAQAFLNVTMYDAFVCCWRAKYLYWTARPFMRITDPAFTTVITTPNFPSYTSGHSTISAAAAGVMGELFPDEAGFFQAQATEAAISRLWGGIHFSQDDDQGLAVGRRIGEKSVHVMRHGFGARLVAAIHRP